MRKEGRKVQEVMEHYGMALLGMLEVSGAFAIISNCLKAGGIVYEVIVCFMEKLCG